ncbi:hypothetical protein HDU86_006307 [Geranomyces michiganensis]|nr:hypothetical protein HDU86_006307 [Geranomyces michiganensis]
MTLPIIAILGATGQQGRAVLDHFCTHHGQSYTIRAVVRDPTKAAAAAAAAAKTDAKGTKVQYLHGDYTDAASLRTAFAGAEYIFAMTNPDMSFAGLEQQWGRNIADAVRDISSVRLLVFSCAPDATTISGGTLECANFAGKAAAQRYMVEIGLPAVFVWPGFFMQNHVPGRPGQPRHIKDSDGVAFDTLVRDDVRVPFVDIADFGALVHALIQNPSQHIGHSIPFVGDWMTFPELAARWARMTGVPATSNRITEAEFAAPFGDNAATANPVCKMLLEMYRFVNQFGYYDGTVSPKAKLAPSTSWETFVQRHWPQSQESSWTPAQTAIARYFRIFDKTHAPTNPVSEPSELFASNGVVSFPFAPTKYANKHIGIQAIKAYYSTWDSIFQFDSWTPLEPRAMGDSGAVVEIECRGRIKTTGKAYDQKYVGVAEVDGAGKITHYTEYWDVSKLSALTP